MARGTLISCAVLFLGVSTLVGCATMQRPVTGSQIVASTTPCPSPPKEVTIQTSRAQNGKVQGFFLDPTNFANLIDSLKQEKDYRDKLAEAARKGGCR